MNAHTLAKDSILELAETLRMAQQARMAFAARRNVTLPPITGTRIIAGVGMVRVVDASTGKVLGFRQTIREARWLAEALERGDRLQGAA